MPFLSTINLQSFRIQEGFSSYHSLQIDDDIRSALEYSVSKIKKFILFNSFKSKTVRWMLST